MLLCVNPGFSYQDPIISPIERVKEFKKSYPSYEGFISIDGGVKENMLTELYDLNVKIAVQGGAIFGNILESINFSKGMSVAMIAALQNNPHPNPKVGAALFDATGKLKLTTTHKRKVQITQKLIF